MNILGIIPARFASTRFPGKPLELIAGKTMLEHVFLRCQESKVFSKIVVATDDQRIYEAAINFGATAVMTNENHPSGTDRCFEACALQEEVFDAIINIQGDEPFISPKAIQQVAMLLSKGAPIATLAVKTDLVDNLTDQNKVKVVLSKSNKALYFSRASIPFQRGVEISDWLKNQDYLIHLGIYGFNAKVIPEIAKLKASKLEDLECLEQLRWLENDFQIMVGIGDSAPIGVDTPKDLEYLNQLIKEGKLDF